MFYRRARTVKLNNRHVKPTVVCYIIYTVATNGESNPFPQRYFRTSWAAMTQRPRAVGRRRAWASAAANALRRRPRWNATRETHLVGSTSAGDRWRASSGGGRRARHSAAMNNCRPFVRGAFRSPRPGKSLVESRRTHARIHTHTLTYAANPLDVFARGAVLPSRITDVFDRFRVLGPHVLACHYNIYYFDWF